MFWTVDFFICFRIFVGAQGCGIFCGAQRFGILGGAALQRCDPAALRDGFSPSGFLAFFHSPWLRFFRQSFSFIRRPGANLALIPVVSSGHIFLNLDLRWLMRIRSRINLRIDQRKRHLSHPCRFTIACPGKNDVVHSRPTQRFRRLLTQHPRNGVRNI